MYRMNYLEKKAETIGLKKSASKKIAMNIFSIKL